MSASVAIDDSIRRLRSSGRSIREIKRLLSCSQARITKALATPEGVSVCRRGRPTKLTPEVLEMVEHSTLAEPRLSNEQLAARITERLGVSISPSLVAHKT